MRKPSQGRGHRGVCRVRQAILRNLFHRAGSPRLVPRLPLHHRGKARLGLASASRLAQARRCLPEPHPRCRSHVSGPHRQGLRAHGTACRDPLPHHPVLRFDGNVLDHRVSHPHAFRPISELCGLRCDGHSGRTEKRQGGCPDGGRNDEIGLGTRPAEHPHPRVGRPPRGSRRRASPFLGAIQPLDPCPALRELPSQRARHSRSSSSYSVSSC